MNSLLFLFFIIVFYAWQDNPNRSLRILGREQDLYMYYTRKKGEGIVCRVRVGEGFAPPCFFVFFHSEGCVP